jgi:GAF domain-containing protein
MPADQPAHGSAPPPPERDDVPVSEELAGVFAQMGGRLLSQETVDTALGLLTSLAVQTLPGTQGAGITLVDARGRKTSAAATDALTERADALQYELDEGPCLAAWATTSPVRMDDVATERRWPRWTRAVAPLDVRSTLSVPLVSSGTTLGAIKVYGDRVGSYDPRAEEILVLFAAQASILIANVLDLDHAHRLSEQLRGALRTRDVISTAKGVVLAQEGGSEENALDRLVGLSQREGRTLRDVAMSIVRAASHRRRR